MRYGFPLYFFVCVTQQLYVSVFLNCFLYDCLHLHVRQKMAKDSYPVFAATKAGHLFLEKMDGFIIAVLDRNRLYSTMSLFDGTAQ